MKTCKKEEQKEYRKIILEKNNKINIKLVHGQEKLEKQLGAFGIEIKPKYGLEPPLSSKIFNSLNGKGQFNWQSSKT